MICVSFHLCNIPLFKNYIIILPFSSIFSDLDHAQSRLVFCLSEACLYVTYKPNTLRQRWTCSSKLFGKHYLRWVPACAVVTQTEIALYLRGKEGNRTTYAEERTEDLEKYGILVVGQDQDRPGIRLGFCILWAAFLSKWILWALKQIFEVVGTTTSRASLAVSPIWWWCQEPWRQRRWLR